MSKKAKCICIIGPESSGTTLVAKTLAHVLGMRSFGSWNGMGWVVDEATDNRLVHASLPFLTPPMYPDLDDWRRRFANSHEMMFIVTTRDITLSESSRIQRFGKSAQQVQEESAQARSILCSVLNNDQKSFVFSYESLMFLGMSYLQRLYRFVGVVSGFMPELKDANRARLLPPKSTD